MTIGLLVNRSSLEPGNQPGSMSGIAEELIVFGDF